MPVGLEDLAAPAAFALGQACQAAVALVLSIPDFGWPDLDAVAALMGQVPVPRTYGDALQSVQILYDFLTRTGAEIHARVHGGTVPVSCLFDVSRHFSRIGVDQTHPESWTAGYAFALWSGTFLSGLRLHHRESIADRAIQRLRACNGAGVKASELARAVGCSVTVLRRVFTRAMGCSIRQYAIELRVVRAIELLQCTDWKVEAIAHGVGWKSKKDLHAAFVRRLGKTPTCVRRLRDTATVPNESPTIDRV